jgi:hypothetical protein
VELTATAQRETVDFARRVEDFVLTQFSRPVKVPTYLVADLPSAGRFADCVVIISDETGGRTLATSDGTDWRRVSDGAVAS